MKRGGSTAHSELHGEAGIIKESSLEEEALVVHGGCGPRVSLEIAF